MHPSRHQHGGCDGLTHQSPIAGSRRASGLDQATAFSGGGNDNAGVFIGDGVEVVRVVREGQALAGSTVNVVNFTFVSGEDGDERTGLNDLGQVAFYAGLSYGNSLIGLW